MKNRHGDEYNFKQIDENTYTVVGDLKYWRFGGKEGEAGVDENDLGFADPSGGPFIAPGYKIDGRRVKRIASTDAGIIFEVE